MNWLTRWLPWSRHPTRRATVYTRAGCHLCDDAIRVLEAHGVGVEAIDVDQSPGDTAKYGDRVPVVVIDGRERFFGVVNPVLLKRLFRQPAR